MGERRPRTYPAKAGQVLADVSRALDGDLPRNALNWQLVELTIDHWRQVEQDVEEGFYYDRSQLQDSKYHLYCCVVYQAAMASHRAPDAQSDIHRLRRSLSKLAFFQPEIGPKPKTAAEVPVSVRVASARELNEIDEATDQLIDDVSYVQKELSDLPEELELEPVSLEEMDADEIIGRVHALVAEMRGEDEDEPEAGTTGPSQQKKQLAPKNERKSLHLDFVFIFQLIMLVMAVFAISIPVYWYLGK